MSVCHPEHHLTISPATASDLVVLCVHAAALGAVQQAGRAQGRCEARCPPYLRSENLQRMRDEQINWAAQGSIFMIASCAQSFLYTRLS
jgi:hypothetical protein